MIEAGHLVKRYGDVRAVDDVSFEIRGGEIVGFLGPNGAGKSTTMKMLTGYLYPDTGDVRIGGEPVDGAGIGARARIGYLPEHTPLYREMRVDRYLGFVGSVRGIGGAARRDAIERVVATCDLHGYAGRRISTLSKGYRQRVGLAQALLSDPDVLILDEPTSGLDPAEIVRIRDLIVGLAAEKTILLSTHVLPEVEEVCRRVLIIAAGKLVADGSLLELSAQTAESLAVVLCADENEASTALAELEGVARVEVTGRGAEGRVRFHLDVEERFDTAERVARFVRDRGWPLFELRHEVPSLERVFLDRTRGLARPHEEQAKEVAS
ncbi:MAG: ATP-binding cassette domain-containing protein [bacterium]|nr:ATP-binding cassette domain-containing protein [bacterium]